MRTFRYADISVSGPHKYRLPICPFTEISTCRNVCLPKCPFTEISAYRNVRHSEQGGNKYSISISIKIGASLGHC